jgi:hypothetical protein
MLHLSAFVVGCLCFRIVSLTAKTGVRVPLGAPVYQTDKSVVFEQTGLLATFLSQRCVTVAHARGSHRLGVVSRNRRDPGQGILWFFQVAYVRVSTNQQGRSGLGIEAKRQPLERSRLARATRSSRRSSRLKQAREATRSIGARNWWPGWPRRERCTAPSRSPSLIDCRGTCLVPRWLKRNAP